MNHSTTAVRRLGLGLLALFALLAMGAGCSPRGAAGASPQAALQYLADSGDLLARAIDAGAGDANASAYGTLYDQQKALRPTSGDAGLQRFQRDMLQCYATARSLDEGRAAVDEYATALVAACEILGEDAEGPDAIDALRRFAVEAGKLSPPGSLTVPHDRMMGDLTHAIQAYDDLEDAYAIDDPLLELAAIDDMDRDARRIAEDTQLLRDAIELRYAEIDAQEDAMASAWRIQERNLQELRGLYAGKQE